MLSLFISMAWETTLPNIVKEDIYKVFEIWNNEYVFGRILKLPKILLGWISKGLFTKWSLFLKLFLMWKDELQFMWHQLKYLVSENHRNDIYGDVKCPLQRPRPNSPPHCKPIITIRPCTLHLHLIEKRLKLFDSLNMP